VASWWPQKEDWVLLEVATALEKRIPIVPVLVDGAKMPAAEELPKGIRALAYRAARVSIAYRTSMRTWRGSPPGSTRSLLFRRPDGFVRVVARVHDELLRSIHIGPVQRLPRRTKTT